MSVQSQNELRATTAKGTRGNPERRDGLLDATLTVLNRKSIVDTTVDDIVRESGVARGTFYIYFRDKFDVLCELARRHNQELYEESHATIDRNARAFDRLRTSLRRVVDSWVRYAGLYRSMNQMALARNDFLELDQCLRFAFIERIREDLESSMSRGHAHAIDAAVAAKALAAMMDRFCLLWFGLNEPPYEGAEEQIDHVVDNLALLWYRSLYGHDPEDVDLGVVVQRPLWP